MTLDPPTLSAVLLVQLVVLATALPLMTGLRRGAPVVWATAALWVQAGSWLAVLATGWAGEAAAALSYALGSLSFVLTLRAVEGWLGPRPLMRWAWGLPLALVVVFAIGHDVPWLRRGVSNLLMATSLAVLVLGLLAPAPTAPAASRRWRWVLATPMALLGLLTLARGVLGLDASADYPSLRGGHPIALGVLTVGSFATVLSALAFLAAWRGEAEALLEAAAQTDPLTGLDNRRALEQRGDALIANARRHGDTLLALMIDLDHFKQVNDRHGHAQGDAVLVLLADILRELMRPGDCAARLGGEEFVVLLGRTRSDGAEAFDRRLREALQARAPEALGFFVDFSAGWSVLRPGDRDVHDLLQRADAALYLAKGDGRGCLRGEPGGAP
ncbi:GGDEF domain-containing protein [Inhella crocodyli]|nr:GGDEF domain-containing protein [Inhella crocodyli]